MSTRATSQCFCNTGAIPIHTKIFSWPDKADLTLAAEQPFHTGKVGLLAYR